jgi:hypothetical protein
MESSSPVGGRCHKNPVVQSRRDRISLTTPVGALLAVAQNDDSDVIETIDDGAKTCDRTRPR